MFHNNNMRVNNKNQPSAGEQSDVSSNCERCGKFSSTHTTRTCKEKVNVAGKVIATNYCTSCNLYGHSWKNCTYKLQHCTTCGRARHTASSCRETIAANGVPVNVLKTFCNIHGIFGPHDCKKNHQNFDGPRPDSNFDNRNFNNERNFDNRNFNNERNFDNRNFNNERNFDNRNFENERNFDNRNFENERNFDNRNFENERNFDNRNFDNRNFENERNFDQSPNQFNKRSSEEHSWEGGGSTSWGVKKTRVDENIETKTEEVLEDGELTSESEQHGKFSSESGSDSSDNESGSSSSDSDSGSDSSDSESESEYGSDSDSDSDYEEAVIPDDGIGNDEENVERVQETFGSQEDLDFGDIDAGGEDMY